MFLLIRFFLLSSLMDYQQPLGLTNMSRLCRFLQAKFEELLYFAKSIEYRDGYLSIKLIMGALQTRHYADTITGEYIPLIIKNWWFTI